MRRVERSRPPGGPSPRAVHRLLLGAALAAFGVPARAAPVPLGPERWAPDAYNGWLGAVSAGVTEPGDDALASMLGDGPGRRLRTRVAAVEHLRVHPHPALGPALMRVFARARFGELPEDPDLFERALRAVQRLPAGDQRRALQEGLAPDLARLAFADLARRWLEPALVGQPAAARDAVLGWPTRSPAAWAALESAVAADIDDAWARHGEALLPAMSVEGGSVAHLAARRVQDAVMGALLLDAPPAARAAMVGVAADRGEDGPAVVRALRHLAETDPAVRTAARSALAPLTGAALPPIGPPPIAPGRSPGLEPRAPAHPDAAARTPGAGPHGTRPTGVVPSLLGIGLLLGAGLAGARTRMRPGRAAAGLAVGIGLLLLLESGLQIAGVEVLADTSPVLSFVEPGAAVLSVPPTGETGWRETSGGSVRAALFPARPAPGVTRVAVLGASSAHGSHALAEETFASVAAARANAAGAPIEAINLGVGGATSAGVRAAGVAALGAGARVLVVYYGHNEVDQIIRLGGYAGLDPRALSLRMRLHRSALYSLLRRALPAPAPTPARPDPGGAPDRAGIERLKALAVTHHRENLEALLRSAEAAGAQVILLPTATNFRFAHLSPHADRGPGDAEDLAARLAHADTLARAGDPDGARAAWQGAIDVGAWPRETTSAIDATTRELAAAHGCAVLDVAALFAARSPDGLTVSGLFWDDLHPTPAGHRVIGEALAPLLVQAHGRTR